MDAPLPHIDDLLLVHEVKGLNRDDRRYRQQITMGKLVRLHRGAFADRVHWERLTVDQQYQLKCTAAVSASRSHPTLSHHSAAALLGIPRIGPHPKLVHVLTSMENGTRTEHGFRKHATREPHFDIVTSGSLSYTGLNRTLVELCSSSSFVAGVVALDWALASPTPHRAPNDPGWRPPRTSPEAILDAASALGLRRGRSALMRALGFADGRAESPGESLSRILIHELGFPDPVLQQPFSDHDGLIGITDFWWPDHGLVGEFDGLGKYIREDYRRGLSAAQVVIDEKRREDRIRATGPRVVRWEWADFTPAQRLFEKLRASGLPSWRRSAWEHGVPRDQVPGPVR